VKFLEIVISGAIDDVLITQTITLEEEPFYQDVEAVMKKIRRVTKNYSLTNIVFNKIEINRCELEDKQTLISATIENVKAKDMYRSWTCVTGGDGYIHNYNFIGSTKACAMQLYKYLTK